MSNLTTKICIRCKRELPLTREFWCRDNKTKSGYHSYCKRCQNEANKIALKKKTEPKQLSLFDEKQCYRCKKVLPRTDFYWFRDSHTKDGYQTRCKQCNYELTREWQKANKETINRNNRIWAQENVEKIRAKNAMWNKLNQAKRQSYENKRRAKKAQSSGSYTDEQVWNLFRDQEGYCFHCGVDLIPIGYHQDHWIPLSKGGSNNIENIRLLCPKCNLRKGNKLPHEWDERYA